MPDHNSLDDLKRAHEEEFFRRHEFQLLEKLRNRAALREAAGTDDTTILDTLAELGYDKDTVRILYLVPVVKTAWVDGDISPAERDAILELARVRGIEEGSGAHAKLLRLMTKPVPNDFFERTITVLGALMRVLPEDRSEIDTRDILAYSTRVAEVSGGLFGVFGLGSRLSREEAHMIERLAEELRRK
jgi:hypothetical protein